MGGGVSGWQGETRVAGWQDERLPVALRPCHRERSEHLPCHHLRPQARICRSRCGVNEPLLSGFPDPRDGLLDGLCER